MKNNKGFVFAASIYSLLILFLLLIVLVMTNLANRRYLFDKQKSEILSKIENTSTSQKFYTVTYVNMDMDYLKAQNDVVPITVMAGDDINLKYNPLGAVRLEGEVGCYDHNVTEYATITIHNIQSDIVISGSMPSDCYVVSGTGENMGDKINCSEEYFYVLSYTSDNIEMLAEYTLDQSGTTVKQGANSLFIFHSFSDSAVSVSSDGFAYGPDCTLYRYVEDYVKYLKSLGVNSASGTLIDYNKYLTSTKLNSYSSDIKDWLLSSGYWTGSAFTSLDIWAVSNGMVSYYTANENSFYVRPVINMSPSEAIIYTNSCS